MQEQYTRKPNTKCLICKKEIYRRPFELEKNGERVFCSTNCFGLFCRKEKRCAVCKKLIPPSRNNKTCSRICANKKRIGTKYKDEGRIYKDKVKNYLQLKIRIMKQRGEKCERCGYAVYQILQVHHIDRNRNDNSLDNLELLCPNCHAKEHYLKN